MIINAVIIIAIMSVIIIVIRTAVVKNVRQVYVKMQNRYLSNFIYICILSIIINNDSKFNWY